MASISIKYPIYIVSKGRAKTPYTAKIFLKENIDFKIVIEPHEEKEYVKTIDKKHILCTDFSNLGLGSYPARNFIFDHSIKEGHQKHFIFDDNIRSFYRLNKGIRKRTDALLALNTLIEFTDKFKNVAISGYNYIYFVTKQTPCPFFINTHVYSAMLINNKIPYRWRLKYNEDVDLCLQALHNKWSTILLNAFLVEKISTVTKLKGGNQEELYKGNDPLKKILKARSLEEIWPQYAKTKLRFNRPHHYVDWNSHFKHPLLKIINNETMLRV